MNDIEVSSIDLVEGGNVFKQGHYLTLGYVPRDEKGETVDLSGKTLNAALWSRKGVAFEAAATFSVGVIRFTLDKVVAAGDYTVEFTATSSTDAKYRKKFPTNQHSGRIAIKQSADDLGVVGIQVYTVAQLKAEQKAIQTQYESTVNAKVQASDAKSTTALTKSTTAEATANDVKSQFEQVVISGDSSVEAAAARVAPDQTFVSLKARLDAKEQATALQLAETTRNAKDDNGGQFPKPLRVPVVSVEVAYPNARNPFLPLWADGNTIYAYGADNTLRKSTDRGKTWVKRGYNAFGFGGYNCFLKLASGVLLNIHSVAGAHIQRSTDDGATWTIVHDWRTNRLPLGSQSWAVDAVTGYIYYGEYTVGDQTDVHLYRSIDDGLTWTPFFAWAGALSGATGVIRHIHAVQWDHIAKRIVVCCGDSTDFTGLWRVNAAGTGMEKLLTNDMLSAANIDVPRSIGIMPFPDYIAWAGDTTLQPYIFRMARSEIGKANPVFERVYRLNSTAWFTCKASDDGSRWVFSASEEGVSLDNLVHLYSVEDQGATVWEVGAIASPGTGVSSLQPVGKPEQGELFTLVSRGFGENLAWTMRMGKGMTPLDRPAPLPNALVQQTASAGYIQLPALSEQVFYVTMAGGLARRMHIFDAGVGLIDQGTATAGPLSVSVRKRGSTIVFSTINFSERYSTRQDMGMAILDHLFTGGDIIEFVIKNNSGVSTVTCAPFVTYGWGTA